jgi:hypothetical protein
MIRTLRAFFLGRLLREKLLLVAFAAFGMLWWLSAFGTRASAFLQQKRRTTAALTEQQQWLDNKPMIDAAAQKAAAKFEQAKTLDGNRLLAAVSGLARDAGLRNTAGNLLPPQTNGQFSVHTLTYRIDRVDWAALAKFYIALEQRSPYIGIADIQVSADPTQINSPNAPLLNVQLRVSAFEINR